MKSKYIEPHKFYALFPFFLIALHNFFAYPNRRGDDMKDWEYCFKTILSTIAEGVMLASPDGQVLYYNKQMGALEGLQPKDVIHQRISDIYNIDEDYSEHHIVAKTGNPIIDRYQVYQSIDKTRISSVASTYPIIKDGEVIATFSVSRDVKQVVDLLNRTQKQEKGPFVDLSISSHNNTRYRFEDIITNDDSMLELIKKAKKFAPFDGCVLIYGETGVGKELIAQSIHNHNPVRKSQPFIALNCSAIPEPLLESILFGSLKGAYTGSETREGLIETAGSGTLFLDEINTMPLSLQAKLLRMIQEGQYRRIGDSTLRDMNCRILSATNESPELCVSNKSLRADLYYRLAVHTLSIPPLRNRLSDIRPLAEHFLEAFKNKYGLFDLEFSNDFMKALLKHSYPGNVRELENIIESAATQVDSTQKIDVNHLPDRVKENTHAPSPIQKTLNDHLRMAEIEIIHKTLKDHDFNISKSAEALGIARQNLQYRMKKLGITKSKSHSNW